MKKLSNYILIIIVIMLKQSLFSEESGDLYLGVNMGMNISQSSSLTYETGNSPAGLDFIGCYCYSFDYVKDNYLGGFNFEYVLFSNHIWSNNLISSVMFKDYNVFSSEGNYILETKYENPDSDHGYSSIFTKVNQKLDVNMFMIDLDLLYKIKFNTFIQFGLAIGPYISIPSRVKAIEKISIKKAYNYSEEVLKYDTIPERDLVYDVKVEDINSYWGLRSNLFLEYEFLESFKATAEIGFSYPFSHLKKDINWKMSSEYLNFRISYKLI